MIYVVEGQDRYLVKQEIEKIIKKHHIAKENVETFHKKDELDSIKNALLSFSLFDENKAVICEDCFHNEHSMQWLLQYIESPNPSTVVLLVFEKLDHRKTFTTFIKKNCHYQLIESLSIKNKSNYIHQLLKNKKIEIELSAQKQFITNMPLDAGMIENEIEKLSLLNQFITVELIEQYSTRYFEDSTFEFVDVFLHRTLQERAHYFNRIKDSEPPMLLIGALAAKLRLLYQVAHFSKTMHFEALQTYLDVKKYPLELAYRFASGKDPMTFLRLLNGLGKLSYDIRHGNVDPILGLQLFVLRKGSYEVD